MRNKLVMAAAFAALVAGCAATASSAQPAVHAPQAVYAGAHPQAPYIRSQPAVGCDVRVVRSAQGVSLRGVARSDASLEGDYSFVVTKSGGGGSSDISQGGEFALTPGAETVLGSADLSMDRGARWRAVLVLERAGAETCRRDVRS